MCVHINIFIQGTGFKLVNSCNLRPNKSQKEIKGIWKQLRLEHDLLKSYTLNELHGSNSESEFSFRKMRAAMEKVTQPAQGVWQHTGQQPVVLAVAVCRDENFKVESAYFVPFLMEEKDYSCNIYHNYNSTMNQLSLYSLLITNSSCLAQEKKIILL